MSVSGNNRWSVKGEIVQRNHSSLVPQLLTLHWSKSIIITHVRQSDLSADSAAVSAVQPARKQVWFKRCRQEQETDEKKGEVHSLKK